MRFFQGKAAECKNIKKNRMAFFIYCHHGQRESQQRQARVDALDAEEMGAAPAVDGAQMEAEQGSGIKGTFTLLFRLPLIQIFA